MEIKNFSANVIEDNYSTLISFFQLHFFNELFTELKVEIYHNSLLL